MTRFSLVLFFTLCISANPSLGEDTLFTEMKYFSETMRYEIESIEDIGAVRFGPLIEPGGLTFLRSTAVTRLR